MDYDVTGMYFNEGRDRVISESPVCIGLHNLVVEGSSGVEAEHDFDTPHSSNVRGKTAHVRTYVGFVLEYKSMSKVHE